MPEAPFAPATLPKLGEHASYLCFDFGLQRTGVAFGTALLGQASPRKTIVADGEKKRFAQIETLIQEWRPDALVVGIPRHPDGKPHEMTARCEKFARQLRGRFGLPVYEVDERYSSVAAESAGAKDLDAGAAVIILEQFLRSLHA